MGSIMHLVPQSNVLLAYTPVPAPTLETSVFLANIYSTHFLGLALEGFYNYSFLLIEFPKKLEVLAFKIRKVAVSLTQEATYQLIY